jgi:hypothetical protein
MENLKLEDITEEIVVEPSSTETVEQDPLQEEYEKVKSQGSGRTQAEKLLYTKRRVEQQLRELGVVDEVEEDDDDAPLTKGEWKRMQQATASQTAVQLAEDIQSEAERELVKYHLQNTIKSSGNPKEDLRIAQSIVNAKKNAQILEQANLRPTPTTHSSGTSAPGKFQPNVELTPDELQFTRQPFNMTKEEILKSRK